MSADTNQMSKIKVGDFVKAKEKQPTTIFIFGKFHTVLREVEGFVSKFEMGGKMVEINGLLYPIGIF